MQHLVGTQQLARVHCGRNDGERLNDLHRARACHSRRQAVAEWQGCTAAVACEVACRHCIASRRSRNTAAPVQQSFNGDSISLCKMKRFEHHHVCS
eukprot:365228-Chlamydomonas_euryale.AAC.19